MSGSRMQTDMEVLESIVQDTYNSGRAGSTSIDGIVSALFICGPGNVAAKLARLFAVYLPIDTNDTNAGVDVPAIVDVKAPLLPVECVGEILSMVLNAARTVACTTIKFSDAEIKTLMDTCTNNAVNGKIPLKVWIDAAFSCRCLMNILDYDHRY